MKKHLGTTLGMAVLLFGPLVALDSFGVSPPEPQPDRLIVTEEPMPTTITLKKIIEGSELTATFTKEEGESREKFAARALAEWKAICEAFEGGGR